MNKNIENIDRYLKDVVPPEHTSYQHRQQLRREVLEEIERRQTMSVTVRGRNWRVAAVFAVVIGVGVVTAAVVGVKYRFVEKRPDLGYMVWSEDGQSMMNITEKHAASPEQAVQTAEEIARLKQEGQREMVHVGEIEVNGQLDSRILGYKYNLSDGRTITVGERDPDDNAPGTLVGERLEEAGRLLREACASRRAARYKLATATEGNEQSGAVRYSAEGGQVGVETDEQSGQMSYSESAGDDTYEKVMQGRTFFFNTWRFTLSDGTEVAWSVGTPKDGQ